MSDFLLSLYPWTKAAHIIAIVAWMAGLLYLPRLFVYHCEAPQGSPQEATFQVMERRLLRGIMNPAMGATYLFGLSLLFTPGIVDLRHEGWIHVKLTLVLALTAYHHALARWRKRFAAGTNTHPQRFYRMINEVPTVLLIGIVVMVVVRPF